MSTNKVRRVQKELADIQTDEHSHVEANLVGGDLTHLKGSFEGPPSSPYEGGTYVVDVRIPSDYPFKPPIMKFETKVWHPNVSSQTGAICLDTLSSAWSPVLTIKSALLSLQSLLSTPEPKDPQDAEVAKMLMQNPKEFERVAKEWAVKYAGAPKRILGESSGGSTGSSKAQREKKLAEESKKDLAKKYDGYNKQLVDRFCDMGFDIERVVAAFKYVGIDRNDGEDYELEEAYMGDVTARLFGEP